MPLTINGRDLERLYTRYNRREFVHPDPLEFLYRYEDAADREIAGLIASSLAYGRVCQILKSVNSVLAGMPHPLAFVRRASEKSLLRAFAGFRHRFTSGEELARMLSGVQCVIEEYGSLRGCFASLMKDDDDTVLPALSAFVKRLVRHDPNPKNSLLPNPEKGSACKRLNLYLRWMVRRDAVDPGGFWGVPASKLIVPLDTHMHRLALALNLTRRKQADMRAALEITAAFAAIVPDDPVRYDFSLTRLGIRSDTDMEAFLQGCRGGKRGEDRSENL